MKRLYVIGERYGRLTVIAEAVRYVSPRGQIHGQVICKCDCGQIATVRTNNLRSGTTTSCGCAKRESSIESGRRRATHGMRRTPTYATWVSMKSRCTNPRLKEYIHYGGRGITVCDRWRESFENFLADMGPRPPGTSLDRINGDMGYAPDNCRWATDVQQQRNRRNNFLISCGGRTLCLSAWAEATGIHVDTIRGRLDSGWSQERALTPK